MTVACVEDGCKQLQMYLVTGAVVSILWNDDVMMVWAVAVELAEVCGMMQNKDGTHIWSKIGKVFL